MTGKKARRSEPPPPQMYELREEVLTRVEGFLSGRLSQTEVREWAVQRLVEHDFRVADALLGYALRSMLIASDTNMTRGDGEAVLRDVQSVFLGRSDYTTRIRYVPPEELERLAPGVLASMDEISAP